MKVQGKNFHTIWIKDIEPEVVQVIDQRKLPFEFEIIDLQTTEDAFLAIRDMIVRGAPLIGITGAFGIYLAIQKYTPEAGDLDSYIQQKADYLKSSRPTAINLATLIDESLKFIYHGKTQEEKLQMALDFAEQAKQREIDFCEQIGEHGLAIIEEIYAKKKDTVNILTHCNAGWLACVDWGTATAPMYKAFLKGIPVHIWVDETRPRNQGARLTAWEMQQMGVPHTVIPDNTGGHLKQHGMVDMVIVGSDRTTYTGDVCNKIGTYLKALAAKANNVPFYVALPSSTFDWEIRDGIKEIPIEQRDESEVKIMEGVQNNSVGEFRIMPEKSPAANYAFDVTPKELVTGLICERGICEAKETSIIKMFPEKRPTEEIND